MKTPRVEDFDPNAPQIKKQPTLKSSLESMPSIEKKPLSTPQSNNHNQPNLPQPERANARTMVRPNGKRIITRNSFETYEDQMESLRKLSFKQRWRVSWEVCPLWSVKQ